MCVERVIRWCVKPPILVGRVIAATKVINMRGWGYNDLELSLTITIPLLMFTRNRMIKKVLPSSIIASPLCGGGLGVLPRARGSCAL